MTTTTTIILPPRGLGPDTHRFARKAMATTFEIFIAYPDATYARQAAWAAFELLDRLEQDLSRYIENSDVSRINNLAPAKPLQVSLDTFACLRASRRAYRETNGAFDITVAALVDCWRGAGATKRAPSKEEIRRAQRLMGMDRIELSESAHTVRLRDGRVQIDLGGIGKGYAIDRMAELLREWDIEAALLHGGYSTVLAFGSSPGKHGWPVGLTLPIEPESQRMLIRLQNRAASGSGLSRGRHIVDPRTARAVEENRTAWSCAPAAAISDALSTALMVMTPAEVKQYCKRHSDTQALIVYEDAATKRSRILRCGRWPEKAEPAK